MYLAVKDMVVFK